jgi:hypothetical protein
MALVLNCGQILGQKAKGQKGWQEKEKEVMSYLDNY